MRGLILLAALAAIALAGVGAASPARAPQSTDTAQGRWVMRDLGTFGATFSEAIAINEQGQVICDSWSMEYADEGTSEYHTAVVWQGGTSIKLGLGGKESGVAAINDQGQVVGWAETRRGDRHAFLWQNGKMRDLGTLGGEESEAIAINGRGQVIGWAATKRKNKDGDEVAHVFLWQNGKMTDIGRGSVVASNDRGQILMDGYGGVRPDGSSISQAFLWQNGKKTRIGTPKDSVTPVALNERGQVIVTMHTRAKGKLYGRGFLWQNGKMRDLGTLQRQKDSIPFDINDRGQVVGWAETRRRDQHAFLWEDGKMRDLRTLPGERDSSALAINERGQVVGDSGGVGEAFLWQKGTMSGLPTPRKLTGFAVALNERSQIVGRTQEFAACAFYDCDRAVLWTFKP